MRQCVCEGEENEKNRFLNLTQAFSPERKKPRLVKSVVIRMPWSYVPCRTKSNKKRFYEKEKTFYRNFRKY
jgi:hypothetical protein